MCEAPFGPFRQMGTVPFFPRGISLLEVLISIFILSIGLLGVAALIPIGKLSLIETNKSDRTGACGRAGIHDVKVRRMCDYRLWWSPLPSGGVVPDADTTLRVIAIDPLGYANLPATLGGAGGIPRYTFREGAGAMTPSTANLLFRWPDELTFDTPANPTTRPRILARQGTYVAPYPALPPEPAITPDEFANDGNFTWFLTVAPSPIETALPVSQRRVYAVAVVVCYKRVLAATGERPIAVTCDTNPGYGGVSVHATGNVLAGPPPLKKDAWVLLYSTGANSQCTWYRVVHAGYDGTDTYITLVGPDWYGGGPTTIVVVDGVTGVYTTTVQLD